MTHSESCRARFQHRHRVFVVEDATTGLDAEVGPDGSPDQGDVMNRRAVAEIAGRCLDESSTGFDSEPASSPFFIIRQAGAFKDDLDRPPCGRSDDARDICPDGFPLAVLKPSDVQHHVDLGGAIGNGERGFVRLCIDVRRAERKSDHSSDPDAASPQHLASRRHAVRVQADRGAMVSPRNLTGHQDVVIRRRGIKQRVIDPGRQLRPRPSPAHRSSVR